MSVGDSAVISVLVPSTAPTTTAPAVRCELKPPAGDVTPEWPTWAPLGSKVPPLGAKQAKKLMK